MILYLHGFRSSPQSRKAGQIRAVMARLGREAEYLCPQLPPSPRAAIELARSVMRDFDPAQSALIGSSLGGYYGTWLAEQSGCRAVLLNPAIRPYEDLRAHLGRQPVYFSDTTIDMRPEYLEELAAIDTPRISRPERYLLVAATGDELIDYRMMRDKYAGCRQRIIRGSDHTIPDFAQYLDEVLAFCGVNRHEE